MIRPEEVTAIVVTKGDRDIQPVLDSLKVFKETIVWDNSQGEDLKVFGRYAVIHRASTDMIYFQDDDCLIDPLALLSEYQRGSVLCNMKPGHAAAAYYQWRIKLVGFGALFSKWDVDLTFKPYLDKFQDDEFFKLECDRIFTALNVCVTCQVPVVDREFASAPDRLWRLPDHGARMREVNRRLREILSA